LVFTKLNLRFESGSVTFTAPGSGATGTFSGPSATYNWNTAQSGAGGHKLQSKVQDAAGNVGMSAPVDVTVSSSDITPPSVTITYPTSGIRVARGVKMSITANASDKVGVALVRTYVDGSVICEQKAGPYSCPWTPDGHGKTNIQVQALDSAGNAAVASVSVFPR
jgi:hypothetical protein